MTIPKDATGHKKAQFYLNNSQDEELRRMAGDLDDLRGVRNDADYRLDKTYVEKEDNVRNWVDVADQIIQCLDGCKNGPLQRHENVAAAIKDYRRKTEAGSS